MEKFGGAGMEIRPIDFVMKKLTALSSVFKNDDNPLLLLRRRAKSLILRCL